MEAALHFRLGDIVYGLSEPRGKVVNTIKLVNDFSKKDILIQNTLTSAVWDYKSPRKYKKDALIKRALSESDRGINFKQWICPYISRHLLSLNPLQARCRRYSRGER
ncbi:hypothetical protein PV0671_3379 [Escherichia coli]|nr:hypothetical protein PV0671_3379 [Escherichia coli]